MIKFTCLLHIYTHILTDFNNTTIVLSILFGAFKIDLSPPPSNGILLIVPSDTSVVVSFVLCFGVDFLCCLNRMHVFIFCLSYWKIAAYDVFSKYKFLSKIVNLVFPPKLMEWEFLSDCAFS